MAPHVDDGEHQPVPEAVVEVAAFLAAQNQTGVQELLLGIALFLHGGAQAVPAVRGKAHPEAGEGSLGQAPALGVGQSRRPGRFI